MPRQSSRVRRPPVRYSPEASGPFDDDYAEEQHDAVVLEDLSESDVTSLESTESDSETDTDLSGFIVPDSEAEATEASGTDDTESTADSAETSCSEECSLDDGTSDNDGSDSSDGSEGCECDGSEGCECDGSEVSEEED